jgi:hypothetical protein
LANITLAGKDNMAQESFKRWQQKSIEQKQTASALILAFSGSAIAFSLNLISGKILFIGVMQSTLFHIQAVSFVVSIVAGTTFSLNRVRDFELTAQVARIREKEPRSPKLSDMRSTMRRLGRITRRLYTTQIISFIVGAVTFLILMAVWYSGALYGVGEERPACGEHAQPYRE